jgi:hypothetical protein
MAEVRGHGPLGQHLKSVRPNEVPQNWRQIGVKLNQFPRVASPTPPPSYQSH